MKTVYLAGAIRPGDEDFAYDKAWREYAISWFTNSTLSKDATIISPLAFKDFDGEKWTMFNRFEMDNNAVLQQDIACITAADVILMNLLPFNENKPSMLCAGFDDDIFGETFTLNRNHPLVGTITEFGIALQQHTPVVVITDSEYLKGHPFIKAGAARIVETIEDGLLYTHGLLSVLLSTRVLRAG